MYLTMDKNSDANQVHPVNMNLVLPPPMTLDRGNSSLHVNPIASTLHNLLLCRIRLPPPLPILLGTLMIRHQLATKSDMSNSSLHASPIASILPSYSLHRIRLPPALPTLLGILMIRNQPATKSDTRNSPPHASSIGSALHNHSRHHRLAP